MADYSVEVLERAVFETKQIYEYIKLDRPSVATRIYNEIRDAIAGLTLFPRKGKPVDESDRIMDGYRFVMVKPYKIYYRIIGKRVIVYHVLDGRMDESAVLKCDRI